MVTEPYQIYGKIISLIINTISELVTEIQKIKHKTDELIVYYKKTILSIQRQFID